MTIEHPDRQAALAWANEAASSTHYMADLFPNRQARYLLHLESEVERLKLLDIRPSTGSDLLWVEGKHRCAATISNNHLWQVEDELASERTLREQAEEKLRMSDACLSVLAISNTRDTLTAHRLPRENPYWTPAQEDVARAIEREIREREGREQADRERERLEDLIVRRIHYRDHDRWQADLFDEAKRIDDARREAKPDAAKGGSE